MLNSVLKDAIKKRDETLSILKGPKFEQIVKQAKSNWIDFSPTKQDVDAAGIDSSFNSTKFQGAELWAVTAVSVKSDGEILVDLHEHGLDSNPELASLASKMEIDACQESVDKADLVLMDGSLYSQFLTRQKSLASSLVNTITKRNNVVFISKTSNTKKQFENLGAIAGDIFYYNHATISPGFSKIHEDPKFGSGMIISSVFARLAESLPLIKIELLGSGYDNDDFKLILNKILKNSVGGYPYALKLAHNNCKISNKDLSKLASIHGLSNEIGSRKVLE
ncbi:DNA double-strand break repair nuclease NurA [Marine Group I thaumarchaeote]|uniref:DNA double-strand break repair nuclease NurA n=1 Tax=Marine Group I thaumarchaeote TaxID=2511932 RepID=A0A7K4NG28_9ARCH|nr:DNA double-strand break repair nuclease NurA [Marine Group I thaumarchaeote]